jgi:hypothetical protein
MRELRESMEMRVGKADKTVSLAARSVEESDEVDANNEEETVSVSLVL